MNGEQKSGEQNKKAAKDFLALVTVGKIDEAFELYVDMNGKHHNMFTPAGFEALKSGMKENDKIFPHKEFTIKHVVAENDMVALHSHLVFKKGENELIVVHLLRFNNGKIVEMWDAGQPLPQDSKNVDGAF